MAAAAGFEPTGSDRAAFEAYVDATEEGFEENRADESGDETPEKRRNDAPDKDKSEVTDDLIDDDELDDEDDDSDTGDDDTGEGEAELIVDSLDSLAEHFDVPPEHVLDNLMVDDIDGEPISIGSALESWREGESNLEERGQELEKGFVDRRDAQEAEINLQAKQLMSLASGMHQILLADYNDDAMAKIQQEDPLRFSELIQRKVRMQEMIRGAIRAGDEIGVQRETTSVEDADRLAQKELKKLIRAKPEWRDSKVRDKGMKRAQRYLTKIAKFSTEEIENIVDHRILVMVDDAVLGRQIRSGKTKKNTEEIKQRGLKRPSLGLRRSARREQGNSKNQARATDMAKLRKSGRGQDAIGLLMEHIED